MEKLVASVGIRCGTSTSAVSSAGWEMITTQGCTQGTHNEDHQEAAKIQARADCSPEESGKGLGCGEGDGCFNNLAAGGEGGQVLDPPPPPPPS